MLHVESAWANDVQQDGCYIHEAINNKAAARARRDLAPFFFFI